MDKLSEYVFGKMMKYSKEDSIKVFVCGGASTVSEDFYKDAYGVGKILADLDVAYLQGGLSDRQTMMGESYHGYVDNGGDKAYFISRKFGTEDILKDFDHLKGVFEVDDIGMLIKAQYMWSDIVVIMPGGTGTLIEMLGYIEQKYDYPNNQPTIILYNKKVDENGFFDDIFNQINKSRQLGFVSSPVIENNFIIVSDFNELNTVLSSQIADKKKIKKIGRKKEK